MYPIRYDTVVDMAKKQAVRSCSVPGCQRVYRSGGYCASHDEQAKRGVTPVSEFTPFLDAGLPCTIRGCDRPVYAKGGCRTHYGVCNAFSIPLDRLQLLYDNPCGICGRDDQVIHVDHDHSCCPGTRSCGNCVRGGLCGSCNMALGAFGDSVAVLQAAVAYLSRGA